MEFPSTLCLDCARLTLRYISLDDIPTVFEASQYPGFTDGMLWEPPSNKDELIGPYHNNVQAWQDGNAYTFSIDTKEPRSFIGRITIRQESEMGTWNIGFWMHPKHQGNGYMTEAVQRILEFGFEALNANKIVACHALWNQASARVLQKSGLRFIRHIPKGFKKRGEWCEENLLGITEEAWREGSEL